MENMERQIPEPFEIYKHFKGNLYQILNIARHSETGETLVIYQALYGTFGIYARPLDMFLSEVDRAKYPDSKEKYRFTKVKFVSKPVSTPVTGPVPSKAGNNIPEGIKAESPAPHQAPGLPHNEYGQKAQELFMEFLDEDDFIKKRNILKAISEIATESMINNMAASLDLVTTGISRDSDIKMIDDYIRARIHFDGARLRG